MVVCKDKTRLQQRTGPRKGPSSLRGGRCGHLWDMISMSSHGGWGWMRTWRTMRREDIAVGFLSCQTSSSFLSYRQRMTCSLSFLLRLPIHHSKSQACAPNSPHTLIRKEWPAFRLVLGSLVRLERDCSSSIKLLQATVLANCWQFFSKRRQIKSRCLPSARGDGTRVSWIEKPPKENEGCLQHLLPGIACRVQGELVSHLSLFFCFSPWADSHGVLCEYRI